MDDDFFADQPALAVVPDPDDDFFDVEPPPEGPRIPRHRNPRDSRPWIRHVDDPDPAPELVWEPEPRIWALPRGGNGHRGRGAYFTRASSFGKGLDSAWLRHEAEKRRLIYACGKHPELVRAAQVVAANPYRDCERGALRAELERLVAKAFEYAGGEAAAWLGTSFHELRAQRDAGVDMSHLDEQTAAGLQMWCEVTAPLELVSSEQFVVNYQMAAAGSYDALFRARRTLAVVNDKGVVQGHVERGELVIGDLKSGRWGVEFAGPPWACQALVYAGGQPYDHDTGARAWPHQSPSQRWAVIVACNPERPEQAGLHWVNLEAARLRAKAVPLWRAACERADLFFAHDEAAQPVEPTSIVAGLAAKVRRAGSADELLDLWREHEAAWVDELNDLVRARLVELADATRDVPAQPLP
jgi:hypothetical protein